MFGAAVMAAYFDRVNLSAQGFYRVPGCGFNFDREVHEGETNAVRGTPFNYFTFGISCSEVEIDVLTGDMRVIRADVIMDMGNPLNPAIDIGQIEGAFVQGMGWCMLEECVWGAATGQYPSCRRVKDRRRKRMGSYVATPRTVFHSWAWHLQNPKLQ